MQRPSGRSPDQLRDIKFTRHYTKHAEGSVLVEFGDTRVLCNASIEARVPPFLRDQGKGWITAEYGMLPRSTGSRMNREASRGKQSGRTQEIQRLIGRSLRAAVDLTMLGENTITVDCDVIQADGGTRTASISGGFVAMQDAIQKLIDAEVIRENPVRSYVASVSAEDSSADTDMNVVMTDQSRYIEVQGTAEGHNFDQQELQSMLALAQSGIETIIAKQKQCLA